MVGTDRKTSTRTVAIITVLTACILPLAAVAAPNIDGRFDSTEGYTTGYHVNFALEGGGSTGGGELWTHVDGAGNVYLAFSQPTDLVDNSYGATQVGWPGMNHKFNHLLKSDMARFLFEDSSGGQIVEVQLDYLYETAKDSGVYDSGIGPGGDSHVDPETLEPMVTAATSLDYNLNTLGYIDIDQDHGDDLTVDSPETVDENSYELVPGSPYPDWIFDVIYEMKIDADVFGTDAFDVSQLTIELVHDSPNKIGDDKVYPEIDGEINGGAGYIPEPLTIVAVLGGIGGLGGYLRKRFGPTAC